MRVLLAALLLLASTLPALARDFGAIVIDDDDGGELDDHVKFYARIRDAGTPVRIRGICVSACTIVFILPRGQACIEPTASFGFHLASRDGHPDPLLTAAVRRRYYPPAVNKWIDDFVAAHGPQGLRRIDYMSAQEAIDLGVFPACSTGDGFADD